MKKDIYSWVSTVYSTSKEREERLRQDVMFSIRKAMRRPMAVIRERQKITENALKEQQKLAVANRANLVRISSATRIEHSPIVAINMLVVEALYLLENRMSIKPPKHKTIIRKALAAVEKFTMADMGPDLRKIVYGKDIGGDLLDSLLKETETESDFLGEEETAMEG